MLTHDDASTALYNAATVHIGVDNFTHTEADRTTNDGLHHGACRIQPT
ncbi:hypothetical protein [Nocardia sp. NPDC049526]